MALNPAYEAIGKTFVEQYYALFDDTNQRQNLVNLYNVSILLITHEVCLSVCYDCRGGAQVEA